MKQKQIKTQNIKHFSKIFFFRGKVGFYTRIVLIFLAIIFTAQACGGQPREERVDLVWWKPFDDPRVVRPLIDEFQKANRNIRVTYVLKDPTTYEQELVNALAAGRGPDIFSIHNDWLPKHQDKIAPFDQSVIGLREFRESFVSVAEQDFFYNNQIFALPLSVDVLALYYNRDLIASAGIPRAPETWQEVVSITPQLTRMDNLGNFTRSAIALGTANNVNRSADILQLLMLQNGTPQYSSDRSRALFDSTVVDALGNQIIPGERALEFYTQFANPGRVTYTWNARSNNSIEAFASGQVAMILSYSYLRPILAVRAQFLNYGIAPMPQPAQVDTKANFANYWGEAVSRQSQHQLTAMRFIKFITSKEVLPKYYEIQKQPSSRYDILEQQLGDPEIGVFAEGVLTAKSFYEPHSDNVERIFDDMIDDVSVRNLLPREALRSATQKVNLIIRPR